MKPQSILLTLLYLARVDSFQLPRIFGGGKPEDVAKVIPTLAGKQKKAIIEACSFTNNGKDASEKEQARVIELVRKIELDYPPSPQLLSDPEEAEILDGVWYLQYTSPSSVGDADQFPDAWKPKNAQEGDSNVETQQFNARGSVSAAGLEVDTSNRIVKQIIDVARSRVTNDVGLDWGRVCVEGSFEQSTSVPNRAVVSFDTCKIEFNNGITLDLGFVFRLIALARGTDKNGWLETTFVDEEMRIGRGNKGTLFVLTRDPRAVQP